MLCKIFSYDFPKIRNLRKIFLRTFENVAPGRLSVTGSYPPFLCLPFASPLPFSPSSPLSLLRSRPQTQLGGWGALLAGEPSLQLPHCRGAPRDIELQRVALILLFFSENQLTTVWLHWPKKCLDAVHDRPPTQWTRCSICKVASVEQCLILRDMRVLRKCKRIARIVKAVFGNVIFLNILRVKSIVVL